MKITARFASRCAACAAPIAVGAAVEWVPGTRARHLACVASVPPSRVSRRRGCGYPGCTGVSHCDECSE
jgi:hypothetical protein